VGKSTLFNALTCSNQAQASNFPFCTIEVVVLLCLMGLQKLRTCFWVMQPNVGSVVVPDRNIEILSKIIKPQRRQFAEVKIVDIAGLVRGASQNAGLGNKFLEHIRQVDAIIHCVRCFPDVGITHVEGTIDPLRDLNIIDTELILSDLQTLENSIERLKYAPAPSFSYSSNRMSPGARQRQVQRRTSCALMCSSGAWPFWALKSPCGRSRGTRRMRMCKRSSRIQAC